MNLSKIFSISIVILAVCITSFSMPFENEQGKMDGGNAIEEKRPFDFSDDFYANNGLDPRQIINRRTGTDGDSVIDSIDSLDHRNVRVIETLPAYDPAGKPLYWASFGGIFEEAFMDDKAGEELLDMAYRYPIYTFPSTIRKGSERQAALIETEKGYFDKNPLGVGVVVLIEYTKKSYSKEGQEALAKFVRRNGLTLDGTPMIKTTEEIADLTRRGLITQKIRGGGGDQRETPFMIAKVLQDVTRGAISPDAFLKTILKDNGKPLDEEVSFVEDFECLQRYGTWCAN